MCASNEHTWQNITDGQTCVHYGTPGMPTPDIVQLVFKFCNEGGGSSNGGSASGSSGSSSGGNSGSSGNPGQGGGPPKPTDPNAPITPGIEDGNGNPWTSPLPTIPPLRRFTLSLTPEQKSWWQNAPAALQQLFSNFLESDNFDKAAEFAREALDALMEGGDVDFTYKVIIDKSFKDNECLMGVFTQLGGAPTFQNYLRNFDSDFSVAHLKLSAKTLPAENQRNAITHQSNNYIVEIEFNLNKLNRPAFDIARTFMHEIIHAEILRKLLGAAGMPHVNFNNYNLQEWTNFMNNLSNNFPGLYDYYIRYEYNTTNSGVLDHQMMAQHYRNVIVQFLQEFRPGLSNEIYQMLAWVGLMGEGEISDSTGLPPNPTVAWQNIPQTERIQIINSIKNYINTNLPCQQ
ncbi:hypothetical protein [Flavobacterium kingsejongi]|uniref:Uncharacterized protein n=1 Tax=Flavobacterium kingsejongi TaxID=1678728 RepID=A0A2S1LM36_9FLAO|nr:hypothetical protein [Flavobacterium kingsejongi]AWG24748.1 hypothetical protein FK004_05650 [Flavobacterium kingsejongi]